jgi:hypothetical protein
MSSWSEANIESALCRTLGHSKHPIPCSNQRLISPSRYFELTNQAHPFSTAQVACARVILDERLTGEWRYPLWLANKAIVAIETKQPMLGPGRGQSCRVRASAIERDVRDYTRSTSEGTSFGLSDCFRGINRGND